jgi:hypothetical protein
MERNRRRSRLVLAATAIGIGGLLALCIAGAWISTALVTVDRKTYDAVHVGQSEPEVRAVLPNQEAGTIADSGGLPAGATCVDYQASLLEQLGADTDGAMVYRFCYRDGRLMDKQIIPSAR